MHSLQASLILNYDNRFYIWRDDEGCSKPLPEPIRPESKVWITKAEKKTFLWELLWYAIMQPKTETYIDS